MGQKVCDGCLEIDKQHCDHREVLWGIYEICAKKDKLNLEAEKMTPEELSKIKKKIQKIEKEERDRQINQALKHKESTIISIENLGEYIKIIDNMISSLKNNKLIKVSTNYILFREYNKVSDIFNLTRVCESLNGYYEAFHNGFYEKLNEIGEVNEII